MQNKIEVTDAEVVKFFTDLLESLPVKGHLMLSALNAYGEARPEFSFYTAGLAEEGRVSNVATVSELRARVARLTPDNMRADKLARLRAEIAGLEGGNEVAS
jgi:hypothetical protein